MGNLEDYFTKEKIENYCLIAFGAGIVGILYAIIAGIWRFAPSPNVNWKIFGTSVIIAVIAIIINYLNDDDN